MTRDGHDHVQYNLAKLKSSLRKFYGIYNICVTNDQGYVPLVNTSRSFPHSWLITGFVTRLTRLVPQVEQELLPFRYTPFLVGFFSFMCMFCRSLFVLFLFAIVFSVLRFTDSDYLPLVSSCDWYDYVQRHNRVYYNLWLVWLCSET